MLDLLVLLEDERETCDGCFLECRAWHGPRKFPCNSKLREWAKRHRDDPVFVSENRLLRAENAKLRKLVRDLGASA